MSVEQSETIAVGMSGGIDSSAVASILRDEGQSIVGVTALMTNEVSRCCSSEDIDSAKKVCRELGIEHHVIDVRDAFSSKVIDYFAEEYIAGRTPSPCVVCNRQIKFGLLREKAAELGAGVIATGHYARVTKGLQGDMHLLRGIDPAKDQSYFLSRLNQQQLSCSLLPLGGMKKDKILAYVDERQLPCRRNSESQEICFVSEGHHGDWLDLRRFDSAGPGMVIDTSGKVLGEHKGIHYYTVGQRRGLGVAAGKPVYVVRIDAELNQIVVGDKKEALGSAMVVADLTWLRGSAPSESFSCGTQIRYNHQAAESHVALRSDGCVDVVFDEPQFAITPGQLAVFYDGDEVLGSGWIEGKFARG